MFINIIKLLDVNARYTGLHVKYYNKMHDQEPSVHVGTTKGYVEHSRSTLTVTTVSLFHSAGATVL